HLEAVPDVLLGELHDLRAAIGRVLDQPLGSKEPKRFAQRRPRDAQTIAERAFVQSRAGGQLALRDQLPELLGEARGQRRPIARRRCRVQLFPANRIQLCHLVYQSPTSLAPSGFSSRMRILPMKTGANYNAAG